VPLEIPFLFLSKTKWGDPARMLEIGTDGRPGIPLQRGRNTRLSPNLVAEFFI